MERDRKWSRRSADGESGMLQSLSLSTRVSWSHTRTHRQKARVWSPEMKASLSATLGWGRGGVRLERLPARELLQRRRRVAEEVQP